MALASNRFLSALGKLGILIVIAAVFLAGLVGTVYLSLRSPEIPVPELVNKSYSEGEAQLEEAGLGIRERAKRFKPGVQPGVILDQSPHAGEVIKAGQIVAVVVSRAPRDGEEAQMAELAEENKKKAEEATRTKNANSAPGEDPAPNRNANQNRRNRNANANVNRNANGNAGDNQNLTQNANRNVNARDANANRRDANANRNANLNRNANVSRERTVNARNTNAAPARNANAGRPAGNANRSPAP